MLNFPKHVLYYENSRQCGNIEKYWSDVWKIASIVEQEAGVGSRSVEFWDFYGYRGINSERIHSGVPMSERTWQDAGHFNQEVGKVVFDAIFLSDPSYGRKVTTNDFDSMITESESERREFIAKNAWVKTEMDELRSRTYIH